MVILEGEGFYGLFVMVVKFYVIFNYFLMFKFCYEGLVEVRDLFYWYLIFFCLKCKKFGSMVII